MKLGAEVNAIEFHWWEVDIGSGNGLVIRQQPITGANIDPNLCCHMEPLGHNELTTYVLKCLKETLIIICANVFIWFTPNTDVHKYYTRQSTYFHIPVVKSDLSKFSIRYRGAVIWNEILKLGIDTCTHEMVFMKSVKSRIHDQRLIELCTLQWTIHTCAEGKITAVTRLYIHIDGNGISISQR